MTTQLAPTPVFKAWDNLGIPLSGGKLFSYIAGTTTKQATFTDSTGGTPNTNPVILNYRGEANVWLDPTKVYKLVLAPANDTDPPTNPFWTVDQISGGSLSPSGSIIPTIDNLFTLGSTSFSWANVYVGPNHAPVLDITSGNFGYYARTVAEIAASVTPTAFVWPEGDIRRYGATTASSNNAAAIQSALTVSANGGAAAYIPSGTWNITTALNAAGNCSMRGEGASSVIAVTGCDGIDFPVWAPSPLIGRRVFRDFSLKGVGVAAFSAIATTVSPSGVFGVVFQNIAIFNFGYMCYMSGFRLCTFTGILGRNNNQGFYMIGQNTNIEIMGCSVTTDVGGLTAVTSQIAGGNSTQGVHLVANYFFGYNIGISVPFVFDLMCVATDFANCTQIGADVTGGVCNCIFDDCLFETNSASLGAVTKGAIIEPLGVTGNSQIIFTNCEFEEITPIAGSIGISIPGANNNGAILNGNQFFQHDKGIVNVAGTNTIMRDNRFFGVTTTCIQIAAACTDNIVGPIFVMNGTPAPFVIITSTPPGLQYFARGSFTITLTGMTAGTTGTVTWVANGSMVTWSISATIQGTSNTTAMTGTGVPAVLCPVTAQNFVSTIINNSVAALGSNSVSAAGVVTFSSAIGGGAFAAANLKGVQPSTITYAYL